MSEFETNKNVALLRALDGSEYDYAEAKLKISAATKVLFGSLFGPITDVLTAAPEDKNSEQEH